LLPLRRCRFAGTLTALNYRFVNPNVMDVHQNVGVVFRLPDRRERASLWRDHRRGRHMMISNYLAIYIQRGEMFLDRPAHHRVPVSARDLGKYQNRVNISKGPKKSAR